jgi:hypothetical protein
MADITLQIVVQPPSMACQGTILDPPLAVKMGITAAVNGYSTDLNRVWAFATLIDEYDEVVNDKLQGTLADSAHSFSGGDSSTGYFLFDNLSIESVGSFRIRVTLMRMDNGSSGAASVQQIESDTIVVEEQEVPRQSPSMIFINPLIECITETIIGSSEQQFLDSLSH